MRNDKANTRTWPELAIGLYDQLTSRNAEISYEMNDLEVFVPSGASVDADQARWRVNGQLTIRTRDRAEA
jgi:hypothetical protein